MQLSIVELAFKNLRFILSYFEGYSPDTSEDLVAVWIQPFLELSSFNPILQRTLTELHLIGVELNLNLWVLDDILNA